MDDSRVIFVEGGSDRKRLLSVLAEPVDIVCTNGTVSPYKLEELIAPYEQHDIYVFVDADDSGDELRALFTRTWPEAIHLHTERAYRQVETTPYRALAIILMAEGFAVRTDLLY